MELENNVKKSDVTRQIIDEKVNEEEYFLLSEIKEEVKKQGGRIDMIKDYLRKFEKEGILKYYPDEKKYVVFKGRVDEIREN